MNKVEIIKNFPIKSNVKMLEPAILEVIEIAKIYGVKCWLSYGALLGIIREGRLLPWNNDAHLECWYEEKIGEKFCLITDALNKKGYHTIFYSSNYSIAIRKKGVVVNINCCWREGKYAVRPHELATKLNRTSTRAFILYWFSRMIVSYPSGNLGNTIVPLSKIEFFKTIIVSIIRILPKKLRRFLFLKTVNGAAKFGGITKKTAIPSRYFDNLISLDFYDGKVLVPAESESLLRYIYGKRWRIPKVNWSYYDDKNKDETGMVFLNESWNYSKMDIV